MPQAARGRRQSSPVSIRARHCWRAMLYVLGRSWYWRRFQSAPAIAGGRCRALAECKSVDEVFQSAPAIAGGRCAIAGLSATTKPSFNPRPPLLAGDAQLVKSCAKAGPVSIRARHCWRAMPARRMTAPTAQSVSIRARHCWRAMRSNVYSVAGKYGFQSAPAIAGGRCGRSRCPPPHSGACFNPRPPLLAGDA